MALNWRALEIAKLELNHLYVEPPAIKNGGRDEGWFCREHAFHTYFLLRLLGLPAAIRVGDFVALLPEGGGLTSLGTDGDHAWCISGETRPVDLSIGFAYYPEYPQLASAVVGRGKNGGFDVEYVSDAERLETLIKAPRQFPRLCYLEHQFEQPDDATLLNHPETFFFASDEHSWLARHGGGVFSKITLHVYKVGRGDTRPLHERMDSKSAFHHIRTRYPAAIQKLHRLLDG